MKGAAATLELLLSAEVRDSQILITKTKLLPLLLFLLCALIQKLLIGNSPPVLGVIAVTRMLFHSTKVRCSKLTKAAIFDSFVSFFLLLLRKRSHTLLHLMLFRSRGNFLHINTWSFSNYVIFLCVNIRLKVVGFT